MSDHGHKWANTISSILCGIVAIVAIYHVAAPYFPSLQRASPLSNSPQSTSQQPRRSLGVPQTYPESSSRKHGYRRRAQHVTNGAQIANAAVDNADDTASASSNEDTGLQAPSDDATHQEEGPSVAPPNRDSSVVTLTPEADIAPKRRDCTISGHFWCDTGTLVSNIDSLSPDHIDVDIQGKAYRYSNVWLSGARPPQSLTAGTPVLIIEAGSCLIDQFTEYSVDQSETLPVDEHGNLSKNVVLNFDSQTFTFLKDPAGATSDTKCPIASGQIICFRAVSRRSLASLRPICG